MATRALDQMYDYRPYGGNRDWSPKKPTMGRVGAHNAKREERRGGKRE